MIVYDLLIAQLALDLPLDGLKGLFGVDGQEVYGSAHWPTDEFQHSASLMSDAIGEEVNLFGREFEVDDGEAEGKAFEDAAC